jgi:hypothetical protein
MRGSVPPFPRYAFMLWCSVKAEELLPLPLPSTFITLRTLLIWYRNKRNFWAKFITRFYLDSENILEPIFSPTQYRFKVYNIFAIPSLCMAVKSETKGHKKAKESRNGIHETQSGMVSGLAQLV